MEYPKFINSAPIGKDLFESGSQERTAESIANHIKADYTIFKLIGLDGVWGSGKSNVISIVKSKLGENYHLFIYDAWSHQEDLQRRPILEELTSDLEAENIIESNKWKENLKNLLAKKKESTTKTVPKLSLAIIATLLVSLITPIFKNISEIPSNDVTKILIASAPILIAVVIWGFAAIRHKKYQNLTNLFYIYKEQELQKTTNEIISEREPSVREFRQWMESLSTDLKKNTVIVFDNMDRLRPDKIQNLWSSIHTFFSESSYDKIWVIVPFDRAHIQEAFKEKDNEKSNEFINKTFSVIFNVSPAVITDWQHFFHNKYKEAFGEHEDSEYHLVKSIFDLHEKQITPRKIITFINELVALKLIWKNEIRLCFMALFTLNRQEIIKDPVKSILEKSFLAKVPQYFKTTADIEDNIAALVYNVPLENASQFTLYREIQIGLREGNKESIQKLSAHPKFYEILEQVVSREEIDLKPLIITLDLLKDDHLNESDRQQFMHIWHTIENKRLETPIDQVEVSDDLKAIVLRAGGGVERVTRYLLLQYANSKEFTGKAYAIAIDNLEALFSENYPSLNFNLLLYEKVLSTSQYIELTRNAKHEPSYYKVTCNFNELENVIKEKIIANDFSEVDLLTKIKDHKFSALKKAVQGLISNSMVLENATQLLNTYKYPSKPPLVTLPPDRTIYDLLESAELNTDVFYELASITQSKLDDFPFDISPYLDVDASNPTIVAEIAKRIEWYRDFGALLLKSLVYPRPLFIEIIKSLISKSSAGQSLGIETILPKYKQISVVLGISEQELLIKLDDWEMFLPAKLSNGQLKQVVPDISMYETILPLELKIKSHIVSAAAVFIETISTTNWKTTLADMSSYEANLLYILFKHNFISEMPANAAEAINTTLNGIATAAIAISQSDLNKWELFLEKSNTKDITGTIKNIRDYFLSQSTISPFQFSIFEQTLRTLGNLKEIKSEDIVRRLLTPVASNDVCLNLMAQNKAFYLPFILKAIETELDFVKALRLKIEANPSAIDLINFSNEIDKKIAPTIKIISARYYTDDDHSIDVSRTIKHKVEAESKLHFIIENEIAEKDPHEGVVKKLLVKYRIDGKEHEKIFEEHKWFNLL